MPVRPALSSDAEVVALHRYPDEQDTPERPVYAGWVAGALTRGTYLGVLLELDSGEVISGAGLTLLEWGPTRNDPQPWRARLVNVWTHPAHRRQGHARAGVLACLDLARARGLRRISLGTTPQARHLYEALGFRASGTELTLQLGDALGAAEVV